MNSFLAFQEIQYSSLAELTGLALLKLVVLAKVRSLCFAGCFSCNIYLFYQFPRFKLPTAGPQEKKKKLMYIFFSIFIATTRNEPRFCRNNQMRQIHCLSVICALIRGFLCFCCFLIPEKTLFPFLVVWPETAVIDFCAEGCAIISLAKVSSPYWSC